jgi:glycosyltransferase involved in cell wall biosynthesis
LFYYSNIKFHKNKIKKVLNRVNYLITDCNRDFEIAKSNGFKGLFLGIIPGGTGFKMNQLKERFSIKERKIILVKGYEHKFGRGLNVVKAIQKLGTELINYEVVVFGAHSSVIDYIEKNNLPYVVYDRHGLSHSDLLTLMGKSLIYIGNSISDGMPNTLLEAIVMGAFPIQSNPGKVTEEIIEHKENGLIIANPEDINEIKNLIWFAIENKKMIDNAITINQIFANDKLDFFENQQKIINLYKKLEK